MMPYPTGTVHITPSGLVPEELENDPNVVQHSKVSTDFHSDDTVILGIQGYFKKRGPGGQHSNVYHYSPDDESWIYFDEKTGLIIYHRLRTVYVQKKRVKKRQHFYVGPEGVSEIQDKDLGRFIKPIADLYGYGDKMIYDKVLKRFFRIDFKQKIVTKGPELSEDGRHRPVQIGRLRKNGFGLHWSAPMIERVDDKAERYSYKELEAITDHYLFSTRSYLLVLDASGRIDLLDRQTLEFAGPAGCLPNPQVSSALIICEPRDLLGYEVLPLSLGVDKNRKYRGMMVASLSREGTAMTVAVFDEKGKLIKGGDTRGRDRSGEPTIPSSKAVFFEAPWASALTVTKYLIENLQPTLFSLTSYFTASSFEATSGHKALFILPNSFVAAHGRKISEDVIGRFFFALMVISPSIILGLLLARWVGRDAVVVGFSKRAKFYWVIGTIFFGLSAYITYRLTRSRETLVTCINCGKLRRPDMERCHRCRSKWHVAELTAPLWRVVE